MRKSFSAESMVLKCILKQPFFNGNKKIVETLRRQERMTLDEIDDDYSSGADGSDEIYRSEEEEEKL